MHSLDIGILHSNVRTFSVSIVGTLLIDLVLYTKRIYTQKQRQYLHLHEDVVFPTGSFPSLSIYIYMYPLYMENWENILFMNKLTVTQSVYS